MKGKDMRKKMMALAGGISLFILLVAMLWLFKTDQLQKWKERDRFSKDSYNAAFLAMYDISTFNEEDFTIYRGVALKKAEYTIDSWRELSKYLFSIFSSNNSVTNIYLGLDPMMMWEKSQKDEEQWSKNLEKYLTPYFTARQDVAFEILLPAPSLHYWISLNSDQLTERLDAYGRFVNSISDYANVTIYFMGGEQWLIANPGNYIHDTQTNAQVSQKIFLHTFCDYDYQIVPGNATIFFERLTSQIEQERELPAEYPDLSDWCIVFFGDSVFDYYSGSYSIPGVVNGLTGAQTYNLGYGGVAATGDPVAVLSFNRMLNHFLEQNTGGVDENSDYYRGLVDYIEEDHEGKRKCFVIEFGLNDYFSGCPVENTLDSYDVETYAGALRTGIKALQDAYPEAEILLLAPTYAKAFSGGTEINGVNGGVLTDYVAAALRVAEEMGVHGLNNYADSGINADSQALYLADGVHPNETGSFLLGNRILEYIGSINSVN